jgi:catechol 2,3-dioxygenase-like lactoylglutathione lyase family enzyme
MIRGLHHVAMATNDVERMLAFYRDALGLEVVLDYTWGDDNVVADRVTALHGSSARSIMLRKANAYVELFQYFSPQPAQGDPARRVCDPGLTHLCFDVVDLDSEYERLSKAGMTFHCPPQDVGPGVRTTYGRDPDGNVVELQEVASGEHRIALPPLA